MQVLLGWGRRVPSCNPGTHRHSLPPQANPHNACHLSVHPVTRSRAPFPPFFPPTPCWKRFNAMGTCLDDGVLDVQQAAIFNLQQGLLGVATFAVVELFVFPTSARFLHNRQLLVGLGALKSQIRGQSDNTPGILLFVVPANCCTWDALIVIVLSQCLHSTKGKRFVPVCVRVAAVFVAPCATTSHGLARPNRSHRWLLGQRRHRPIRPSNGR